MKIALLLMDRAFFTVECINLVKGPGMDFFIAPCICNARIQGAVDSLGKRPCRSRSMTA